MILASELSSSPAVRAPLAASKGMEGSERRPVGQDHLIREIIQS